jgi:small subunit ribosomal protein S17e
VDRIKRISFEVLDAHKSKFGEDFVENKKALNEIAIVRSKGLKTRLLVILQDLSKNKFVKIKLNMIVVVWIILMLKSKNLH